MNSAAMIKQVATLLCRWEAELDRLTDPQTTDDLNDLEYAQLQHDKMLAGAKCRRYIRLLRNVLQESQS